MKETKWEQPVIETVDDIDAKQQSITEREPRMMGYVEAVEAVHKKRKLKIRVLQGIATICILGFIVLSRTSYGEAYDAVSVQKGIADQILRFHILANSDSEEDQTLKLKVKGEIVSYLQEALKDCTTKEEAKEVIRAHFAEITEIARRVIEQEGYQYDVKVEIADHYFPVKVYGDLVFPEGEYEALRVLIGKAEGKNWWCVMFPSLCMVNETYSVVPEDSKETLQKVLTEEEYEAIDTEQKNPENTQDTGNNESPAAEPTKEPEANVEYRFWIVDFLSDLL